MVGSGSVQMVIKTARSVIIMRDDGDYRSSDTHCLLDLRSRKRTIRRKIRKRRRF